jgi:pyruvate kinase
MESQSKVSGAVLRGSNITLSKIITPNDPASRKTKIVCTLGPACWEVSQIESLIDAGLSVARLNFSHGDHETHKRTLDRIREAAKNKDKHVAVMLDTKGPEIRTGFFADGASKIVLVKGESITLTSDYSFKGSAKKLACSYQSLATSVKQGQMILVADGSLVLTVLSCDPTAGEVECRIENNAVIGERKNMNLPGVHVDLPTCTEKDINDIQNFACKYDLDFIAASFVRKASDVEFIRSKLGDKDGQIKIISKIENLEGMENYPEILRATDAVMVARGDLGMEIPPEKVFLAQKMMIREANIVGKPAITATQMLESMINNPRPTRAECSDVANAVLDGTDCVMLSGETANGEHPTEAVKIMARTCVEAETAINFGGLYQAIRNSSLNRYGNLGTPESIASSAVKTAIDINSSCIIVCSESGATARFIAKYRPGMPVHVLTTCETVARQCNGILKGTDSRLLPCLAETDAVIKKTVTQLLESGDVKSGEPIVIVHGSTNKSGATNTMKIIYA